MVNYERSDVKNQKSEKDNVVIISQGKTKNGAEKFGIEKRGLGKKKIGE